MVEESTRLRVIRAIIGWDRKTMSSRLGVHPTTVTKWEHGKTTPDTTARRKIETICSEYGIAIRPDGFPVPVSE
jgi:ribosome-binding protein aMBF1 (putative translation factor)